MTLTYQEKELQILREAVDKAEEITAKNLVQSETVKNIINIVENFLIKKNVYAMVVQQLIIYYQYKTNSIIKI